MEDSALDYSFFEKYNLHCRIRSMQLTPDENEKVTLIDMMSRLIASQTEVVRKFRILAEKETQLFQDDDNDLLFHYNRNMLIEEQSRLEMDLTMNLIQFMWLDKKDKNLDDYYFIRRYEEYAHFCLDNRIDEIPRFFGWKCFDGIKLNIDELSIPFDEHNIWDAVLLLLSAEWISWKPMIHIVTPSFNGNINLPYVTLYGDKALVSFCSTDEKPLGNKQNNIIFQNFVLVQKKNDSFKVIGGYKVYIGMACVEDSYVDAPKLNNSSSDAK